MTDKGLERVGGGGIEQKGKRTHGRGEQMAASGVQRLGDGEIEQKTKGIHGHGQQCGDCWGKEV